MSFDRTYKPTNRQTDKQTNGDYYFIYLDDQVSKEEYRNKIGEKSK